MKEIKNQDNMSEHKPIHKRNTPKHMVMDLIYAFYKLELEGVPLSLKTYITEETIALYSKRITEIILPILHEYGIRIHEDQGQFYDFDKKIQDMTFHETIHVLTIILESQFMDQVKVALEKGTLQKIYDKLIHLNTSKFAFQDDLLFNHYQRSLNQLINVTPKNDETTQAFKRLQRVIRKQRSRAPILHEQDTFICPSCTKALYSYKQRFCQQCGQKLLKD